MGEEEPAVAVKTKRKESTPPDGYVCRLCSVPGHWIQVCPTKKTGSKRKRNSDHVPVPGKDPSEEDIERARELQKIPPPKCFCGTASRLNKVNRSKEGGDDSRAIGKYFFFCSKKRDDETQCRFARPVDAELKKQKKISARSKNKSSDGATEKQGDGKKGEAKKPKLICKFFAKTGKCKKGKNCEFSHDVPAKDQCSLVPANKMPEKKEKKDQMSDKKKIEKDDESSSDDSSSDGSSSSNDSDEGEERKNKGGEERDKKDDQSESGSSSSDSDGSSSDDESD